MTKERLNGNKPQSKSSRETEGLTLSEKLLNMYEIWQIPGMAMVKELL